MSNETKGCLFFEICGVVILLTFLYAIIRDYNNKYYFVEETGYFHSTNDEDKCKFIKSANEHGYTISKIDKNIPIENGYLICKECFTHNEQEDYIKKYNWKKKIKQFDSDRVDWLLLSSSHLLNKQFDYDKLHVYIDTNNMLHIDGNCFNCPLEDVRLKRYSFSEIDSISSTCEECVDREFCDFIYKKIDEGVYDINAIKDVIDNEDH